MNHILYLLIAYVAMLPQDNTNLREILRKGSSHRESQSVDTDSVSIAEDLILSKQKYSFQIYSSAFDDHIGVWTPKFHKPSLSHRFKFFHMLNVY